jgi:hypothetical protein
MTSEQIIASIATHRDYGPSRIQHAKHFCPSFSSKRLNIAYPRGEIAQRAF